MTLGKAMIVAAVAALVWPTAAAQSYPANPVGAVAGRAVPVDVPGQSITTPGASAGTYAHRFGRLHDLRRLDGAPSPGAPQHRFGLPDNLQIPGRFVRPDRIGPFNRRLVPRLLDD